MSGEVETSRDVTSGLGATGFLDFARNDGYVKKFWRAIVDLA